MVYEVLFYNGWVEPPAYYLVTDASGDSPEQALENNLARIIQQVRTTFALDLSDGSDSSLKETIYLLREDGLVPARNFLTGTNTPTNIIKE